MEDFVKENQQKLQDADGVKHGEMEVKMGEKQVVESTEKDDLIPGSQIVEDSGLILRPLCSLNG